MVRSWEQRVRGASQKAIATVEEINDAADDALDEAGVERLHARAAHLLADALALAVSAADMAVAVADRTTGEIQWSSEEWIERFGVQSTFARHLPSATDLGESPLPDAGQSWKRTRTMIFADGSEDLVDLLLLGAATDDDQHFVTIVAKDRSGSGPVVTDRAEVSDVIDAALGEPSGTGLLAVLYVDLDRFKVVHDLVGNIEALRLLDLVDRRIKATVRAADLVFRLPSDEFVIVGSELEDAGAAEELAERVRNAVATLTDVGHDMALTASIGVAVAESEDDHTGESLMSAAETAVYLAKGRGRNRVAVHDEELRSRTQRLLVVERQLRRAIDRRDVRFAYQPVVRIGDGQVIGAEALLRLGGDVGLSAVEVVAAAEHSGLMGALGTLVLEGVEEQLGSVLRGVRDHVVMVNLLATLLVDEPLLAVLARLATDESIPSRRLAVEVPELVVREQRSAFDRLAALVRPRFQIGIDGFGTSFSSVDIVRQLPVDYVKLHRSITATVGSTVDDRARLSELIAAANEASIDVIALGVERLDQAGALRALGCPLAQGFLYAGAVTSDDLMRLIDEGFAETTAGQPV